MRKRGLFAITTLAVLAILLVPSFSVFAWNLGIHTDRNCDEVIVTADPSVWFEDHSGQSQIRWVPEPETITGTGTFPWGTLQTSMQGTVSVTYRKYTSNNGGNSWTATSVTSIESGNWSVNRPGNCQITICHVAGLASDPANYNTLTISINAALGHFYENGTPKAGHEQDSLGACQPPPPPPVLGCTDPDAINYDPAATVDDGSCQFPYQVCSMTGDWVFADATEWALESEGGTLEVRTVCYNEYDAQDGTTVCNRYCEAEHRPYVPEPIPGCMNPDAINYDPGATQDDGSCEYPPEVVPGCTDPNALNYNEEATVDNGSCEYPPPPPVPGCTDVNATNYDPNATQDDGSCQYPPPPEVCQYNPELTADDPECQAPPPEVCQYNTQIPADDPACQPPPPQYHPPEEPATGPEGALPIAEGIAFLAFAGLGAFGIRRMNKK